MLQVTLQPGLPRGSWALLRPLCGHDEAFVGDTGAMAAATLLDRLLVETPGTTVGPGKAWDLAVCDRDRLLGIIYLQYFGERIESTVPCESCTEPFELIFSLRDLMTRLDDKKLTDVKGPDANAVYTLADGQRFRLPNSADLHSVSRLGPDAVAEALLERCMVGSDPAVDCAAVHAAMEQVGPVLDTDLDAACPKCGAPQKVRFDIQAYLLRTLLHEKQFLIHEVHRIALAYGWSLDGILALSRADRRAYVRLIEASGGPRKRVWQ